MPSLPLGQADERAEDLQRRARPDEISRYTGVYPSEAPEFENPDGTRRTYKPFLPGLAGSGSLLAEQLLDPAFAAVSPFGPDKAAGVDSLGLVGGALAMSGLWDSVESAVNRRPAETLDRFYRMELWRNEEGSQAVPAGLDEAGLPCYYTVGGAESFLSGGYRFTKSDLERMSVRIPDVSLLRPGDLLVRQAVSETRSFVDAADSAANGEPHVGIVVALDWETAPGYGCGGESRTVDAGSLRGLGAPGVSDGKPRQVGKPRGDVRRVYHLS